MGTDIMGAALLDYQNGDYTEDLITISSLEEEDRIPLPYLFRDFEEMPFIEQRALELCKGTVLDIGCAAGSHSLYLQKHGTEVFALDRSEGAIETCRLRGIKNTVRANILHYQNNKFDTLLMLMNGIGIAEKLDDLGPFLQHLKTLLNPNGQILLDSSDIIYMFEQDEDGGFWVPDNGKYYGEVEYTMAYKGKKSKSFSWLYIGFDRLKAIAEAHDFSCERVISGAHYDYLARLWLNR
ncbi:MAG: class I SAM-dependent methyltransferase [Flavobacteriales bacterium]|nr:MAG: class I SAM-dependent methyltransferase [Flavobacteriales bacterium]